MLPQLGWIDRKGKLVAEKMQVKKDKTRIKLHYSKRDKQYDIEISPVKKSDAGSYRCGAYIFDDKKWKYTTKYALSVLPAKGS